MIKLRDRLGVEKGRPMLVVGGGGSVRDGESSISKFIEEKNPVLIGVNKLMPYVTPKYHLWTNTQRYRDMGNCIDPSSIMLFGSGLSKKIIRMHYTKDDYIVVNYTSDLKKAKSETIRYSKGKIYGHIRTAGCLSIMICHLFEASDIFVVGMDGFTLHEKDELDNCEENQHCYGAGYTDKDGWDVCVQKDKIVYDNLRDLNNYGISFKLITPTVFDEFYDVSVLGVKNG